MLLYPFRFAESIIKTFPHQDIGRYPNHIDGMSTLDLYKIHAEQRRLLMTAVNADCERIESAINGHWNGA
jgi:hypothetical protein